MPIYKPCISLLVLLWGTAHAGALFEYATTDHAANREIMDSILVQDGMLRMDPGANSPESTGIIFRDDMLYLLDHKARNYRAMSRAELQRMAEQVSPMIQQLQEQLAALPPEQRKQMEQMMPNMASAGGAPTVEMRNTRKTAVVDDFDCEIWELLIDQQRKHELCLVAASQIEGGAELAVALRALAEFQQELVSTMGLQGALDEPLMLLRDLNGVPVESKTFASDNVVQTMRLKSATKRDLTDADFLPPPDFVEVQSGL